MFDVKISVQRSLQWYIMIYKATVICVFKIVFIFIQTKKSIWRTLYLIASNNQEHGVTNGKYRTETCCH